MSVNSRPRHYPYPQRTRGFWSFLGKEYFWKYHGFRKYCIVWAWDDSHKFQTINIWLVFEVDITHTLIEYLWALFLITGLQKQSKEPYNKQLINLKYFILIYGKISNLALVVFTSLSLGQYDYRSWFEIFPLRPLFRLISGMNVACLPLPLTCYWSSLTY